MRVAVIQYPGSNCDYDVLYILRNLLGLETELVWHRTFKHSDYDATILPGGFSYGDYLRAGAIAAHSPSISEVEEMSREGKAVIGICNGFQILVEAGILSGALLRNDCLTFVCDWVTLRVQSSRTSSTRLIPEGTVLHIPIAHSEGRYVNEKRGLKELYENDQVVFKYVDGQGNELQVNPNGSLDNIAGICNLEGNVVGLMPHPERASEPSLGPYGSDDGLLVFESMLDYINDWRGN